MSADILTQQDLKKLIHYNPSTGVFTWHKRDIKYFHRECDWKIWNSRFSGKTAGWVHNHHAGKKYIDVRILGNTYKSHRLAFLYITGSFPENDVDHINGDGCDNRWANIRDVTVAENNKNARLHSRNKSGFVGVSWHKKTGKWRAYLSVQGNAFHLGLFDDLDDAIDARKLANIKYGYHFNHGQTRPL